ncbi:MAG TPA: NADH-quinone oxidoreductase subunit L [Actinomycetota bacterium]|nr:NADH-quinone oxidoreductase subunit L [Actinomycetota bacterium]
MVGVLAAETAEGAEHAAAAANWFVQNAWLIPLLPFISGVLTLAFGRRTPGKGPVYGILAVFAALVLSLGVLWSFVQGGGPYERTADWFTVGPLHLEAGILVDGLTAVMVVVVTFVSLMVHVYSIGYMHGDVRYTWFYVVLSLFTGAMLLVVVSNNVIQLLVGWEIMGVCSYLLIGHWFEERTNSNAAIKAFITTRIGDVPMMFGFFALIAATGFTTTNIGETTEAIAHGEVSTLFVTAAALLLFGGTIGKSAQFPLHVWLPDAMAGPTPVSALIHAATMVAAGVYLVGRLFEVFVVAGEDVLFVVSVVAAITMLGAAILAIAQDDIKRVLAYSTLSQLAYMVAGLSLGEEGFTAGFFHLFTHAFFKALLFLGAGAVIHAVHSNDMSDMGGLRKSMPVTFWTMLIGSLALAGIVPFAGFWSKDELLVVANDTGTTWLFVMFLGTAFVTAFYTARMVLLTFFGEFRGHGHPHEAPASMTGPLVLLAAATVGVGVLGAPQLGAVFSEWVYFGHPHEAHFVMWIAAISTLGAVLGIAGGWALYRQRKDPDPMQQALGPVWTVLVHRYYIDDFYMAAIVRPIRDRVSAGIDWINQNVIDGVVNGAALLTRALSRVVAWVDRNVIDGAANAAGGVTGTTGGLLKYLQSGNVQWYAVVLFVGVIALTIVFTRVA